VSLGGPIFDIEKLSWLNGQWLRDLPVEEFAARAEVGVQFRIHDEDRAARAGPRRNLQPGCTAGRVLLCRWREPDAKLFESKKLSGDQVRQLMQLILWKLESLRQWEKDSITATIQAVVESLELKLRDAMPLMFAAITGQASSVSVLDAMEILGPDLTRFRLRQAIDLLGGVSKKENKEWEKLLGAIA
jgi:glutamyl-tRNA synthetase